MKWIRYAEGMSAKSKTYRRFNNAIQTDTTKPVITIIGDNPLEVRQNENYVEQGATITDDDPNYSETVTIGGDTVNDALVGTYIVTYDAPSDAAGNILLQVTRTVIVQDA